MYSTIAIHWHDRMTAEQKLEQIQFPIENLKHLLSMMTKMHMDVPVSGEEFTALMNTLHYQVSEIDRVIH